MMFRLTLLSLVASLAAGIPGGAEAAPAAPPVVGCPSLVNLRMLLRQTKDDPSAAVAILGNDQADHFGCALLTRDAVTALQEHLSLNGRDYDCLTLRSTSVCHWVMAGAVDLNQPPAKARGSDKAKGPDKTQDKARR